ncbi:MAG: helicase C-terminal domain-containing protein [Pyrobaculum sp.]
MRFLLNAPPGFGKSRLLARLALQHSPSLIFVRSHVEGLQMARYIKELGGDASLLFGRSVLCPFKASDSKQCFELRERGVCKARSKTLYFIPSTIDDIYGLGVCPYEALHAAGRSRDVLILPHAYVAKLGNAEAVADLFEDLEFVALDEVHNFLEAVEVSEVEEYSGRFCDFEKRLCLALPLVGRLVEGVGRVLAASASVTRPFAGVFTYFLGAEYISVDELPGEENLVVEAIPLPVRYKTRTTPRIMSAVEELVRRAYGEFRKVAVFLPNKELAQLYLRKLSDIPSSERPLGDVDHVLVTYYGSPYSEGVSLSVKAGVLVGFPIPNVKSPELWAKVRLLKKAGFDGYKYGVMFTAVNHVIQAVGRVARDLKDEEKFVFLVDDRFKWYKHLLPSYLSKAL